MKTHMVRVRERRDGSTHTSSLCGRLNRACSDGMNVTDVAANVTCKFCKARMAADNMSDTDGEKR